MINEIAHDTGSHMLRLLVITVCISFYKLKPHKSSTQTDRRIGRWAHHCKHTQLRWQATRSLEHTHQQAQLKAFVICKPNTLGWP
jgi:hypothetical protein